jgi:hypothetical protein
MNNNNIAIFTVVWYVIFMSQDLKMGVKNESFHTSTKQKSLTKGELIPNPSARDVCWPKKKKKNWTKAWESRSFLLLYRKQTSRLQIHDSLLNQTNIKKALKRRFQSISHYSSTKLAVTWETSIKIFNVSFNLRWKKKQ